MMRAALGMAVSALCLASPALAGEGAAHRGDAPLLFQDNAIARPVVGSALPLDFRLRAAVDTTKPSLLDDPQGRVVRRISSSMFDYYPMGGESGFHFSAGVRYFSRVNLAVEAQKMTHGLLYTPNWKVFGLNRAGFRKFTPAFTMGYTSAVTHNLLVGLETGAMLGKANISAPSALRHPTMGAALQERSGINPMASLVMGFRF